MFTMANEGGSRAYWPMYMGVNLSNGNLHFADAWVPGTRVDKLSTQNSLPLACP
jgi:hypothetical protein